MANDDWEAAVKEPGACLHCTSYNGKEELTCDWGAGQVYPETCEACRVPFCKGRSWVFACKTCGHITYLAKGAKL